MRELDFTVYGAAVPQGSMKAVPAGNRHFVIPNNERELKMWRGLVIDKAREARQANGIDSPFSAAFVELTFSFNRPAGHFGTRGLLRSAPLEKTTAPDLDKLMRAVFDSLTAASIVLDDAHITIVHARKIFGEPSCKVNVRELELHQDQLFARSET